MINKLKAKKDELNSEIKKKNKEFEKALRVPDKARLHTESLRLEGKFEAYVEIIKLLEEENDK